MSAADKRDPICAHRIFTSHHLTPGQQHANDVLTSSPLFCELLANAQNSLELRWGAFLTAWGISFEYSRHDTSSFGLEQLPSFYLPGVGVWLDIRELEECSDISLILDEYIPFVWNSEQTVLFLFGPPRIRIPEAQGWALQLLKGELVATPVHLTECPTCGGFRASGVGSVSLRKKRPAHYRDIELRAQTPQLQAAYEIARQPQLLWH